MPLRGRHGMMTRVRLRLETGRTHQIRVHMAHLRQKLERDPGQPVYLRTEAGIGYRLGCV